MVNGVKALTKGGTPRGGHLSPLLANILLDDLDKKPEKRDHRFLRYALMIVMFTLKAKEQAKG